MASADTTNEFFLQNLIRDAGFQLRCYYRFIAAAISVTSEAVTANTSAATAVGSATLTFATTPANIAGLSPSDLNSLGSIPAGAKVLSTTATTATLTQNIISPAIGSGDTIQFAPGFHAQRMAFAGALFANNVSLPMLVSVVLSSATVKSEALADTATMGGNVTDADIDAQVTSAFTGIATARSW